MKKVVLGIVVVVVLAVIFFNHEKDEDVLISTDDGRVWGYDKDGDGSIDDVVAVVVN